MKRYLLDNHKDDAPIVQIQLVAAMTKARRAAEESYRLCVTTKVRPAAVDGPHGRPVNWKTQVASPVLVATVAFAAVPEPDHLVPDQRHERDRIQSHQDVGRVVGHGNINPHGHLPQTCGETPSRRLLVVVGEHLPPVLVSRKIGNHASLAEPRFHPHLSHHPPVLELELVQQHARWSTPN